MTNSTTTTKTYNSLYVYAISLSAALGSLFFGYINSVMNPLQDYIQDNIYTTMSDSLMTLTSSLVPAGAAIGAFIAADLAKKVGRRNAMFITDAVSVLGVIITLIGNQYCLLFGRLISGVCVGFNSSLVPLYIAEVSPAEARGITGSFTQLFVALGILVAYLFGLNVPTGQDYATTKWWWRFMLGFGILIAVVRSLILLVAFKSDTPKYLLANDKEEATIKVLGKIYKKDQVAEELDLLKKDKEINAQAGQIRYRDLISPQYRSRFIIGCLLAMLQQFSGINAIIYYSTSLFEDKNDPNSRKPQIYTVIVGILTVTSSFIATLVIKRVGRRQLLLVGSVVLFVALILLPIVGWAAPDAGSASKYFIFLFILGHGFSLSSVVWIYISEILPDIGVGVATLLCWISCVIVAQVFPYLMDGIGSEATWLILACIVFVGFIFILKWVPETKGKQPHEIAALFSNNKGKIQDLVEYVDQQTRKTTNLPEVTEVKSDGASASAGVEEKV